MVTFALGAALAAVAGQFVTLTYSLMPSIGMLWTLKAMIVIVLAGTGSILGALPAGILLGIVEALTGAYLAQTYKEVAGLVIFLLVLILRPQGLFVRK
jgi:branched-chain amino acid transport system permease protein